jgi:5-methylcytosine-specific restriction endonuclease McrA
VPLADPDARREWQRRYYLRRKAEINARSKAYHEANRERMVRLQAERYRASREEITAERRRQYAEDAEHRARVLSGCRKSRARNAEACRQRGAAWRESHPELMRQYRAAYKRRNLARQADYRAERRARIAGLPSERIDRAAVFLRDDGWCYLCGYAVDETDWHLDHVTPIARGGSHTSGNVAVTHPRCNQSKGARLVHEFQAAAA